MGVYGHICNTLIKEKKHFKQINWYKNAYFNPYFFKQQLRESIAEHKPHIDKLLKIGPQLKELNPEEGEMVGEKYQKAENTYAQIKEEVRQRALALDEAVSQSAQVRVCLKLI